MPCCGSTGDSFSSKKRPVEAEKGPIRKERERKKERKEKERNKQILKEVKDRETRALKEKEKKVQNKIRSIFTTIEIGQSFKVKVKMTKKGICQNLGPNKIKSQRTSEEWSWW